MTDLIVGMGEVGSTLYALFTSRGIDVMGADMDESKSRNFKALPNYEVLHICIPYNTSFIKGVVDWCDLAKPDYCIIHSTVPAGTCRKIQQRVTSRPIVCSPTLGVHSRFLEDVMRYPKHFAVDNEGILKIGEIMDGLRLRFPQIKRLQTFETCELAKILCDTSYYGVLIAYRKATDKIAQKHKVDPDEMWTFAEKIHEFLNNRPIMFNDGKPIGGHCVLPNLELGDTDDVDFQAIKNFIRMFGA